MTPRVFLNVMIPGHPHAWERVGWSRGRSYDPNSRAKDDFRWALLAAVPRLKVECFARLAVELRVWTGKMDAWNEDIDNFAKFYLDAMTPPKEKKRRRRKGIFEKLEPETNIPFPRWAVWKDDRQVDFLQVEVHRSALQPRVEILVFEVVPRGENGSL